MLGNLNDKLTLHPLQSFLDAKSEQIQEVVQTNLLGCLLCTRAAMRLMAAQPRGGHIFNMDGAGADGLPTPQYAAYGATKAGVFQLLWRLGCHHQSENGALAESGNFHQSKQGLSAQKSVCLYLPGRWVTENLVEGA